MANPMLSPSEWALFHICKGQLKAVGSSRNTTNSACDLMNGG